MKIHFPKLLKAIVTLFSVWFGLSLAKFLSFDFALDIKLFFLVFLIPLIIYLILEIIANRKYLWELVKKESKKRKMATVSRAEKIQERMVIFSSLFSGGAGKGLALTVGYLISYLLEIMNLIKKTIFSKYNFLAFSFFGILFEIVYLPVSVDSIIIFLTLFWILTVRLFKFKGEVSVKIALVLLPFCPYLLSRNQSFLAEKVAVWVFMFLVVGVLEMVWEGRKIVEEMGDNR